MTETANTDPTCARCGHARSAHTFDGTDRPMGAGAGACTVEVDHDHEGAFYCDCLRFAAEAPK
jgi:hypothetical protein